MLLGPTVVHDILCVFYSWFLATNRPTCNFFLAPPLQQGCEQKTRTTWIANQEFIGLLDSASDSQLILRIGWLKHFMRRLTFLRKGLFLNLTLNFPNSNCNLPFPEQQMCPYVPQHIEYCYTAHIEVHTDHVHQSKPVILHTTNAYEGIIFYMQVWRLCICLFCAPRALMWFHVCNRLMQKKGWHHTMFLFHRINSSVSFNKGQHIFFSNVWNSK